VHACIYNNCHQFLSSVDNVYIVSFFLINDELALLLLFFTLYAHVTLIRMKIALKYLVMDLIGINIPFRNYFVNGAS
jgi:hypothetical protein